MILKERYEIFNDSTFLTFCTYCHIFGLCVAHTTSFQKSINSSNIFISTKRLQFQTYGIHIYFNKDIRTQVSSARRLHFSHTRIATYSAAQCRLQFFTSGEIHFMASEHDSILFVECVCEKFKIAQTNRKLSIFEKKKTKGNFYQFNVIVQICFSRQINIFLL